MTLAPFMNGIVIEAVESHDGFPTVEIQAKVMLGKVGHQIEAIDHKKIKDAITSAVGCAVTFKPVPNGGIK